ncbi:MAG: hypothetical protein ACRC80_14930 [Waterburya sp.]
MSDAILSHNMCAAKNNDFDNSFKEPGDYASTPSSDDIYDAIASIPNYEPEKLGEFFIDGTTQMDGSTFQKNILYISQAKEQADSKDFIRLINEIEKQGSDAGAKEIRILNYALVNNKLEKLLTNPKFATRYGLKVRQIDNGVLEIIRKIN